MFKWQFPTFKLLFVVSAIVEVAIVGHSHTSVTHAPCHASPEVGYDD